MSVNTEKAEPSAEEILVGACELGLLEAAWQYFLNRPTIGSYLFVIDAPTIAKTHSLPPNQISQFGLTGFLTAPDHPENLKRKSREEKIQFYAKQSEDYPLTVGLTEIVSRYLFDQSWSGNRPKIMSSAQLDSVSRILDGLERDASYEMSQTLSNVDKKNALKDIIQRLQKDNNSNPQKFIESVTADLEKTLPVMYGAYNHTRQLLRFAGVLPLENDIDEVDEKLVFMHTYEEIDEILNFDSNYWQSSPRDPLKEFDELVRIWHAAIAPPGVQNNDSNSDGIYENNTDTRSENATVLAQIEFVNREFRKKGKDIRLVFITTTARLFDSAVKRFNCTSNSQYTRYGPLARFSKAYYIHKLLSEANPDVDSDQALLRDAPLFDPRILLCDPNFVSYAAYDKKAEVDVQARAISKWLPLFFSSKLSGSIKENTQILFSTYQYWQTDIRRIANENILKPSEFDSNAFTEIVINWDQYVRLVAVAGGLGRVVHHQIMHDIIAMLKANDNPAAAFKKLVSNRLNESMSDWLTAMGRKAIREWNTSYLNTAITRAMPPLIMPVFDGAQAVFKDLENADHLENLPSSTLNLLNNPTKSVIGMQLTADDHATLKARYIQMLCLAAVFYKMSSWDSAYLLASQAFALAEQVLSKQTDDDEYEYISGREAAYFASVCLRRTSYSIRYAISLPAEGHAWCARYERAVRAEKEKASLAAERYNLHLLRSKIERLTWSAIKVVAHASQSKTATSYLYMNEAADLLHKGNQLAGELITLNTSLDKTLSEDSIAKACYSTALSYLKRQLALVRLQVVIFAPNCLPPNNIADLLKDQGQILRESSRVVAPPLADEEIHRSVEHLLLDVSDKISIESKNYQITYSSSENEPYTAWRDATLKNILDELQT